MATATFRIWRGDRGDGEFQDYTTEISDGMVVLDAVHQIQAEQANDLAVRWNCKAGKCGSCSAEINGMPKLMCMTRLNTLPLDQAGDHRADEDISADSAIWSRTCRWNFEVKKTHSEIQAAQARCARTAPGACSRRMSTASQEFRKCIECFLCQDVCHVLRDHHMHDEFIGPRFLVYAAALEMNPLDTDDRVQDLRKKHGIGLCNITKCCTKVCPESITITDNAIIPLKERVVDRFFDPLGKLFRSFGSGE